MKVLYYIPCLVILLLIVLSHKESLSQENVKERWLIPFHKVVKRLCRFSIVRHYLNKWISYLDKEYRVLHSTVDTRPQTAQKCQRIIAFSLLIICLGSFLAGTMAFANGNDSVTSLERKETGNGKVMYELNAKIGNETRNIPITVEELDYTEEEVNEWFKYACENIATLIMGENVSLDSVDGDLDLIDSIPGSAIKVSWECSNYSLIQPSGELRYENLTEEGKPVKLTAVFSYKDYEKRHELNLTVKKKEYKGIERYFNELEESIVKSESESRVEKKYSLPEEVEGKKVSYNFYQEDNAWVLLVLAVITAVLLPLEEKSLVSKKVQEKERQLIREYPELVCKLSLYLGAGMSISKAWEKVALLYTASLAGGGKRNLCNDEVLYTYRQLQSGVLKSASFQEFGNRCRLRPYKKLSMLINSNIRLGSADLYEVLQLESREAMENQKSEVIKLAGEASAKLMLPMIMELVVVIGVLMIPAFMSLNF